MRKRAEDVAGTRLRIVEATEKLHGTIGPATTTITAIAEAAGVTRLTVYRHFADDVSLFAACSQLWASRQVFPDTKTWVVPEDPVERVRVALTDLYRFYRDAEPMLSNVHRDAAAVPPPLRESNAAEDARRRDVLLAAFSARGAHRRRLRAVLAHVTSFPTWRSLCHENGLSDRDGVDAMVALVSASASAQNRNQQPRPRSRHPHGHPR